MQPMDLLGTTNDVVGSVQYMHVPDGFLNTAVSILCWIISLFILTIAVRRASTDYDEQLVPLAGVMAAFIFAAQMINFPVAGGTSGHLIGATFVFIVLGPWLGLLVMTAVIALQALLFQDGGLIVMGANILIMGIVSGFVGYGVYKLALNRGRTARLAAAGVGAWLSVVIAALLTAVLLGISGTASLNLVVPLMVGIHILIGLGEALITVAALAFLISSRPQLFSAQAASKSGRWLLAGLGIILLILLISPFASSSPDGLQWVAEQQAFIDKALDAPYTILPNYTVPGLGETEPATILAGILGALLVGIVVIFVSRSLRKDRDRRST